MPENDTEVKHVHVTIATIENEYHHSGVDKLLSSVSNLNKSKRTVAWILRAARRLRQKIKSK